MTSAIVVLSFIVTSPMGGIAAHSQARAALPHMRRAKARGGSLQVEL